MSGFLKIAHRGASAYEPENTLRAYQRAIELGANAIELDIRQTKDKKLVVIHDDNLKRLTGLKMRVTDLTLKEIKGITIKGEKIVTLGEALDFMDRKVQKIFLELKETGTERKVLHEVRMRNLMDRVIVISFYEDVLKHIKTAGTMVETGLIYTKHPDPLKSALELNARYILPMYRFTHTRNVVQARQNNLKVIVWTINTVAEAMEYVRKGVDGIATDKPDILRDI